MLFNSSTNIKRFHYIKLFYENVILIYIIFLRYILRVNYFSASRFVTFKIFWKIITVFFDYVIPYCKVMYNVRVIEFL